MVNCALLVVLSAKGDLIGNRSRLRSQVDRVSRLADISMPLWSILRIGLFLREYLSTLLRKTVRSWGPVTVWSPTGALLRDSGLASHSIQSERSPTGSEPRRTW